MGGTPGLARWLRPAVGARIAAAGLAHRDTELPSPMASVWADGSGEATYVDTDAVEVLFDGYLHRHGAPTLADHLPVLAERVVDGRAPLLGAESGVFNLVVRDKRTDRIHLAADPSGMFPIYFGQTGTEFFFGSHLFLTAKALGAEPDLLGAAFLVLEQFAYGSRTYFEGVDRLCPGEAVTFDGRTGAIERRYPETYFDAYDDPDPAIAERLWEALLETAGAAIEDGSSVGVMMSEGFDSRLMSGVFRHLGADLNTFTHGTDGTAGTAITHDVAAQLGSNHCFESLSDGYPSDLDNLRHLLLLTDNLHVPFWSHGTDHFHQKGIGVVTTGCSLDSTLGIADFGASAGSDVRRAFDRYGSIVRQDLGQLSDEHIEGRARSVLAATLDVDLDELGNRVRRFLAPELAAEVATRIQEVPGAIAAEHDRLRASGASLDSQVLQRFGLENRGRRFAFGQDLTLRTKNHLVVPSYEPTFMRLASRVHPRHRLHHKLYLQLFRQHLPDLARIRTGAHGVPATYPRVVLETGRFARKVVESRAADRYLAVRGEMGTTGIRDVLFPEKTARDAPAFAVEHLFDRDTVVINQESMQLTVDKIRRFEIRVYPQSFYLGLELTQVFDEL